MGNCRRALGSVGGDHRRGFPGKPSTGPPGCRMVKRKLRSHVISSQGLSIPWSTFGFPHCRCISYTQSISSHYVQHGITENAYVSSSSAHQVTVFYKDQGRPRPCHILSESFSQQYKESTSNHSFRLANQAWTAASSSTWCPRATDSGKVESDYLHTNRKYSKCGCTSILLLRSSTFTHTR